MQMNVTISERMRLELEDLSRESGLSIADCASDILEGNFERLRPGVDLEMTAYEAAMERIANRTPEQITAAQCRAMENLPPPRSLPSGKTLADMVFGKWPGKETDEEIIAALKELS